MTTGCCIVVIGLLSNHPQYRLHEKQLKNVEYLNYLGSMIINATCTCKIKSRSAVAKAAFNKKKNLFNCILDLNLRKKLLVAT